MNGTTQAINVNSSPKSSVKVNGMAMGKTPTVIQIKRKGEQTLVFSKKGYDSETVRLTSSTSGWIGGNLFPFGLISLVIGGAFDTISGGAYILSPETVSVELEKTGYSKKKKKKVSDDDDDDD